MSQSSLNNEFFAKACQEWTEQLSKGTLTSEAIQRSKVEVERERQKLDPWKAKHFEPIWGVKKVYDLPPNLLDLASEPTTSTSTLSTRPRRSATAVKRSSPRSNSEQIKPNNVESQDIKESQSESKKPKKEEEEKEVKEEPEVKVNESSAEKAVREVMEEVKNEDQEDEKSNVIEEPVIDEMHHDSDFSTPNTPLSEPPSVPSFTLPTTPVPEDDLPSIPSASASTPPISIPATPPMTDTVDSAPKAAVVTPPNLPSAPSTPEQSQITPESVSPIPIPSTSMSASSSGTCSPVTNDPIAKELGLMVPVSEVDPTILPRTFTAKMTRPRTNVSILVIYSILALFYQSIPFH